MVLIVGKTKVLEENMFSVIFSTTNLTLTGE